MGREGNNRMKFTLHHMMTIAAHREKCLPHKDSVIHTVKQAHHHKVTILLLKERENCSAVDSWLEV